MGHIKEPAGVDFIIKSRELTKAEEIAISEYIKAYKAKSSQKKAATKLKVGITNKRKKVIAWFSIRTKTQMPLTAGNCDAGF